MGRAIHMAGLVLGLSLAGNPAAAQTANAAWQSTPASVLKAALRNVVAAQDRHRATRGVYASSVEALRLKQGSELRVQIMMATATAWRAKATHRARPGRSCVVFVGRSAGVEPPRTENDGEMAGEERVPLCDRME